MLASSVFGKTLMTSISGACVSKLLICFSIYKKIRES